MSAIKFEKKQAFFCFGSGLLCILALSLFCAFRILAFREASSYRERASLSLIYASSAKSKSEKKEIVRRELLPLYESKRRELAFSRHDFLEVDLQGMEITFFEKGLPQKKVDILTKGDSRTWNGTAAGLYRVEGGWRNAYSVTTEAYMPWAVKFYGKYFIHGRPYYPDGAEIVSDFSGGCLRLENKAAREIFQTTELGMPVLVVDASRDEYRYRNKQLTSFPEVSADSFLAADLRSGTVLAEKESEKMLPVASLTKLMTALVVSENLGLGEQIEITSEMLAAHGSTTAFKTGQKLRVVDLFYPLLVESSNDAASALAQFLGREETVELMNEKADSIMMENTVFTGPSGYQPGNVSTARDLFYLARYISNVRFPIWKITKSEETEGYGLFPFGVENLWNKNVFIHDPAFIGGKTGFTGDAENSGLFVFRMKTEKGKQRQIVIVVLGSQNQKRDVQLLYGWLLKNYFPETKIELAKWRPF